jgi:hypothetical protein
MVCSAFTFVGQTLAQLRLNRGIPMTAHDFEVQKQLHQKIRNDPDYDDWEYGTEPLPHESWQAAPGQAAAISVDPLDAAAELTPEPPQTQTS